ncbi:TIM barrel protein [Allorhizobium taibaishanense]|uniref:2-keto-myo-inositol isomerase n=1 Tax=Allorhizobium taibaishanense TaxID=887144 RepID=A0A1Q9A7P4_9HYPH|nr:TIM barrel protein [Allorhizobium taibaishanense]MBB4008189.1 2-keto-myo-inositol isomerase [Allorhizobium taibaishanense]OLP50601.1 xylose isomerase [Allorhizobium taibaishanense]
MTAPIFALNHMVAPQLPLGAFFKLGKTLGINQFEIRNDLSGNAILDGTKPETVRDLAAAEGAEIISINALQRFNEWTPEREEEARSLAGYAAACGAKALVLVPVNDGSGKLDGERQSNLRTALTNLKPILDQAGIIGLVEPLGFQICSLRSKKEAVEAIQAINGTDRFKLVHDTFHHVLAGEPDLFAAMTGLVHISGVDDGKVGIDDMRDPHRVMVTEHDRLDNVGQIKSLLAAGYTGPFSFEPFAASVHASSDPQTLIRNSIELVRGKI